MSTPTPTPTSSLAVTLVASIVEGSTATFTTTFTQELVEFTSTAASVVAEATAPPNPLLRYLPSFTRSLVVQLLVLSVVACLHFVLALHLAFTTRYHLPLAKVNYVLLTSGCATSFISIIWQLSEIGVDARRRAREWPFMFDYLEFVFPAPSWSTPKSVLWLSFNGISVLLSHVAHIHVLTLLYPSNLEARFLLAILLPLALISCALSFSPLLSSQRERDIFDSGAAVCNSTLTLLYTCALIFWGAYIARQRAWGQSDASGSTAVFGACAIGMAIIGSALSFISVERGTDIIGGDGGWLTKLTWIVLLWQTWFSVWWWIGAGMYEAEKPLDEDEAGNIALTERVRSKSSSLRRIVDDGLGSLRKRRSTRRRHNAAVVSGTSRHGSEAEGEAIEMMSMQGRDGRLPAHLADTLSATSSTVTTTPPTFISTLLRHIRKAHKSAAKRAHRNMLVTAAENPNVNEAMIGRRGNGWSVSGILKSRQDHVLKRAAAAASSPTSGDDTSREDRLVGAQRLEDDDEINNNDWQDVSEEYSPRRGNLTSRANIAAAPVPVESRRLQNWRRRDVTRYD